MFVRLRNASETAVRLGIPVSKAKQEGARMLSMPAVKRAVKRLDKADEQTLAYVKTGLSRLAFGQVNDAVSLVFAEQPTPEQISRADLFNVSEIKRVKGGGVEMKFFDRQKALEKLFELDPELREETKASRFLSAVCSSGQDDITQLLEDKEEESAE
ncbi:MAG: terminase small subunit [Ruminococcus sp.]|nr:terminase small subunit [Ruminococcus sp.]